MQKTLILALALYLSGCAIYSHETMVSTHYMEGTLDYQKVAGSDYNYIVVLAELTPSGGDLSEYDTSTPQRREMTARIILSSEYHAKCKSVKVVRESSFTDNEHQKKWARGTWWKLDVQCD